MPNLEYSVRFVLASDSTAQIDEALRRMRETGSTINIKVKVDSSGITREMRAVESEIKKTEASTERLSRTTEKSSKQFSKLSGEIRKAMTEFKATGNVEDKARDFESLGRRIEDYGDRLRLAGKDLDTYYQLLNKLASAEGTVVNAMNNSKAVLDARAKAERTVAMEATKANLAIARGVRGTVFELKRLAYEGKATEEQIMRLFGRSVKSAEDLEVTTIDLTKAFAQQRAIIEASNLPLETRERLLRNVIIGQQDASRTMGMMNRSLNQQEGDVGNVSYAMMSFTRLLEDIPYGFRGFANNIQPTIFGLVQMNEHTQAAADNFKKLHGKEMPLAQRAMLNFRQALSGPVNQLLLLTSVIAVAGTFIERYMQQSKKAEDSAKTLSERYLALYQAISLTNSVLGFNYDETINSLKSYKGATDDVVKSIEEEIKALEKRLTLSLAVGGRGRANVEAKEIRALIKVEKERLSVAETLSDEAKEKLSTLEQEKSVQDEIIRQDNVRFEILNRQISNRNRDAGVTLKQVQDELQIEKVRVRLGDEAAARTKKDLALENAYIDGAIAINDKKLIEARYELEIFNIRNKSTKSAREIRNEYEAMLRALQRQLADEQELSTVGGLRIEQAREIEDIQLRVAERRKEGETISIEQENELIRLINERYKIVIAISEVQSKRIVDGLGRELVVTQALVKAAQARLDYDEQTALQLEYQAEELEYQIELQEQTNSIRLSDFASQEDMNRALTFATEQLKQQYLLSLMNQQLQDRADVEDYVRPMSNEGQAIQERQDAELASLSYFLAEKQKLMLDDSLSEQERLKRIAEANEDHNLRMEEITKRGQEIISFVRFKTTKEGLDLVTGALEQFANGAEARNKKQFEFQKKLAIGLATINTYLAVSEVLKDPFIQPTWLKYVQAGAMLVQGLAQVNSIRNTQYGGTSSGGVSGGRQSAPQQGFQEVMPTQALAGATSTMNNQTQSMNITVIGNVDREGIAFAVRDGEDMISSRATFASR